MCYTLRGKTLSCVYTELERECVRIYTANNVLYTIYIFICQRYKDPLIFMFTRTLTIFYNSLKKNIKNNIKL